MENIRGSGGISDGVHMFVMDVSFSEWEFNGMCDGEGMVRIDSPKVDWGSEFETVGKMAGFNLFYES